MRKLYRYCILFVIAALILALPASAGAAGPSNRVSVVTGGGQATGDGSFGPALSPDGRSVVFYSGATNLAAGDVAGYTDAFVHDRKTVTTTRLSLAADGSEPDNNIGGSYIGISANRRYVVFDSMANNIVSPPLALHNINVYVRDTKTNKSELISVAYDGGEANGNSSMPSISNDGRYVAFASDASNLVAADTNGAEYDIFVRDRKKRTTALISLAADGSQGTMRSDFPRISGNGRYVVFRAYSDLAPEDTNGTRDFCVRDLKKKTTRLASVAYDGSMPGTGGGNWVTISADGRYVAFESDNDFTSLPTGGFTQVYVRDMKAGATVCASVDDDGNIGDQNSGRPSISTGGRFVTFESEATNLVSSGSAHMSVYVHDVKTGVTRRVSETTDGDEANGDSSSPAISEDGTLIAFDSGGDNLVDGDTNVQNDVFVACNPAIVVTPKSPADNTTLAPGVDKAKLAWKPVSSVKKKLVPKYEVQVTIGTHVVTPFKTVVSKKTSLLVKGLEPDTMYAWRVRPILKDGTPCDWNPGSYYGYEFQTSLTKPPALVKPRNNAKEIKPVVTLSWKRPKGAPKATTYLLDVATDAGFTAKIYDEEPVAATKYVVDDSHIPINPAPVAYYWRVKARDAGNTRDYSDWSAPRIFLR